MKKFLSLLTIIILVASVGLLTGCGPEIVGTKLSESQDMSGTVAGKLTLNGSTSMTRVCQALGEAFSEKYPGVSVEKSDPPVSLPGYRCMCGQLFGQLPLFRFVLLVFEMLLNFSRLASR